MIGVIVRGENTTEAQPVGFDSVNEAVYVVGRVNNQAIEARDKVSGVSLDTEAADLIRFQQAYQASAKAMQVAGTLFDAILQVR